MKIQLDNKDSLIIETSFGQLTLSIDNNFCQLMYQNDNLKEFGKTGNSFENEKGEQVCIETVLKGSDYKKYQIAIPENETEQNINDFYIINEYHNTISERLNIDEFLEYWDINAFHKLIDYKQLLEYIQEKNILLSNDTFNNKNDYYIITNFK